MLCFESEFPSVPPFTASPISASAFCGDHFAKARINEASINFVPPRCKTLPSQLSVKVRCFVLEQVLSCIVHKAQANIKLPRRPSDRANAKRGAYRFTCIARRKKGRAREGRRNYARVYHKLYAKAYRRLSLVVVSQSAGSASMRHDGKGNAVLKVSHVASARCEIYGRYYRGNGKPV